MTQFKVQAEQERLAGLEAAKAAMEAEIETIQKEQKAAQEKTQPAIDRIGISPGSPVSDSFVCG